MTNTKTVTVPVEPDDAMTKAFYTYFRSRASYGVVVLPDGFKFAEAFAVVIAAAPKADSSQQAIYQMRQLAGGGWVETDADGETCLKRMPHWRVVFEFRTLYTAPKAEAAPQAQDKPVHEQNARFAIEGAIAYGRGDVNKPPSGDHWLMPYWKMGRQLAQAEDEGPAGYATWKDAAVAERVRRVNAERAALSAQEGWKRVPIEPTPEMLEVYKSWHREGKGYMDVSIYKAMIAAAPSTDKE